MVLSSSCPNIVVFSSPASSTTVVLKDGLLLRLLLQMMAMVFSFKMEDGRHQGGVYLDQERACRGSYNRGRLLDCTNADLKNHQAVWDCLGFPHVEYIFGIWSRYFHLCDEVGKSTKIINKYNLDFSRSIFVIVQIGMTATFHASPVFH